MDRLGIAVEFVDEIPRQERLRELDAPASSHFKVASAPARSLRIGQR
jgi:hypothetical protein